MVDGLGLYNIALLVLAGLTASFFAVFVYYYKHHIYYTKYIIPRTLKWVFLEVQMPRENTGSADQKNTNTTSEEKKNLIAIAEQLFTTLSETGGHASLFGPRDYISFEIACIDKKISFYINCPKALQELVEKQIHAQYPHAFIDQIKIYNPFIKDGHIEAVELKPSKKYVYPIRTYKNMESDPLNSITNAMSKLGDGDGAAVQYILSPAGLSWQRKPRHMALEIQQGKHQDTVGKGIFGRIVSEFGHELSRSVSGINKNDSEKSHAHKDLSGAYSPIQLTPMQQEIVKRLEEKASRPGFEVNIRIVTSSPSREMAKVHMQNLVSSFLQFNMPPFNSFVLAGRNKESTIREYVFRVFRSYVWKKRILNTEEITSLWHLPNQFIETPNIKWLVSKKAPPPIQMSATGLLLGKNIYRNQETKVHIERDDRRRHMYIIGRTGVGKTEIMKNMSVQDIQNGEGLCVIDPHGDFIEDILPHIPKERAEDVILFEPADMDRPMGLNMLEAPNEAQKDFAVQEMISIFYKLVTDPAMLGPMFEHNMRNAMLTLMADSEHPGTLVEIPRIFTDTDFQKYKVSKLTDPLVRAYWEKEMAKTSDFHKSEMLGYLISKVGRFVENGMIRNIVGQPHSSFNFREIMDNQKILLVNLAKGKVGEMNAKLLGLILVSKLQMAALSRADTPESERKDFYLYVDEFQNFITDAF